jgi:hypothetical protein
LIEQRQTQRLPLLSSNVLISSNALASASAVTNQPAR